MSSSKNCNCKDSTIVEGIFDEKNWQTEEARASENDFMQRGDAETVPRNVKSYTLRNANRMEVVLIDWGATIVSIKCPDKYGRTGDVVLGFDDLESYANPRLNQYFGCVLGRCANRISEGSFAIGARDYQVTRNESHKHHLHGGIDGFSRKTWNSCVDGCTVVMSHMSEDGCEGYPGDVLATIRFKLTPDNRLEIGMRATTTKPTVVNLSHGSLFNLAGHDAGCDELMKHRICLNCDRWTFTDPGDPVPTGAVRGVGGTVMDLRVPRVLADILEKIPGGQGFDHNFCVTRPGASQFGGYFAARAFHAESGRILEVYSNQPGVQFYTGSALPSSRPDDQNPQDSEEENCAERILGDSTSAESFDEIGEAPEVWDEDILGERTNETSLTYIPGKGGARYRKFGAFSLQPQNYPNAINFPHFPCSVLRPGQVYCHDLMYKFGIQLGNYI